MYYFLSCALKTKLDKNQTNTEITTKISTDRTNTYIAYFQFDNVLTLIYSTNKIVLRKGTILGKNLYKWKRIYAK